MPWNARLISREAPSRTRTEIPPARCHREIALRDGPIPRVALSTIWWALFSKATSMSWTQEPHYIDIDIPSFGWRKIFSLDIADHLDLLSATDNVIGYKFPTVKEEGCNPEERAPASSLGDTVGFMGLAISKRVRVAADASSGTKRKFQMQASVKYMQFTEHPEHPNEFKVNMATDTVSIRAYVTWWDSSGERRGGVPLSAPEGKEDYAYVLHSGQWYPVGQVPATCKADIDRAFPVYMDKKLR